MIIKVISVPFSSPISNQVILRPFLTPTPVDQSWTLLLTGDIIPARVVNQRMNEKKDFDWPLREIAPVLKDADIAFADLEAPLLTNCRITNEGFQFCGDARFAMSLNNAGIDIVNLANNHSMNYGQSGIEETKLLLGAQQIDWTGFGKKSIMMVKGVKVGFLGYNAVGQRLSEEEIKNEITLFKPEIDVLIIAVHWGKEYERVPMPDLSMAPDDPKIWGRKFIDWGADIVAGNHPHWYQGIEWYKEKPIFYAMGNTVFDQEWSTETKRGFLAKLVLQNNKVDKDITFFPIGIRDYGQAYLLEGKEKEDILQYLH